MIALLFTTAAGYLAYTGHVNIYQLIGLVVMGFACQFCATFRGTKRYY